LERSGDPTRLHRLAEAGNIALLERPLRVMTLVITVQAALRRRHRQNEFREYLHQYERYQERVRQAQKLESLGVLAGGIAHDFNYILTGIVGNASLAAEFLPPGDRARSVIDDVVTSSERAAALTNQMPAYAGKGNFVVRPLDISETVHKLGDFFRASVPERVEVRTNLGSGLPPIEADESQLEQIVMNPVINAAEAISEERSGIVRVGTSRCELSPDSPIHFQGAAPPPGTYSIFEVSDNGVGMDEKTIGRIFHPFFTTKFLGRGLGLAAVQGIVRRHRGGLAVESTPGEGTTFTIFFPAAEAKAAAEVFRNFTDRIDLVLLDMNMPVMDGEAALRELQAIRPDVRVILWSGFNEPSRTPFRRRRPGRLHPKALHQQPPQGQDQAGHGKRPLDAN
jgi:signal transduction histidine kinase